MNHAAERINETNDTRWSMNCRFKSIFSPYGDKKLGEFFDCKGEFDGEIDGLKLKLDGLLLGICVDDIFVLVEELTNGD